MWGGGITSGDKPNIVIFIALSLALLILVWYGGISSSDKPH